MYLGRNSVRKAKLVFKTDTVHVVVFSCVPWFEGEVVVRFVDIGRIVGHHYLNFLFITKNTMPVRDHHIVRQAYSGHSQS